jgi:hypothetical protein
MSTNYKGWRVPKDVIIVAKDCGRWVDGKRTLGELQGYIVDPDNKTMLQNALGWARWTEYVGELNTTTLKYEQQIEHEGVQYLFKNEGFRLELLECANGSTQGGKLSFWNCKVSKDGREFIVGIASDYLLDILLHNDFKNGVCQSTLSFARCKGGVGMMNESMPSYQQFLKDEEHRTTMKKGKTKKRVPGHLYSTLTGGDVYFTTFYRWYIPVYEDTPYWRTPRKLTGFRKLEAPIVMNWSPWYNEDFTKKSDYFRRGIYFSDSTPARTDSGLVAEIDISDEDVLDKHLDTCFVQKINNYGVETFRQSVGLSLDKESYEMPEWLREVITGRGYKLID